MNEKKPIAMIEELDDALAPDGRRVRLVHVRCPFCECLHVHPGGYEGEPIELIYALRVAPCTDRVYDVRWAELWQKQWARIYVILTEDHRRAFPEDERSTSEIFKDIMENFAEQGLVRKDEDESYNVPFLVDSRN